MHVFLKKTVGAVYMCAGSRFQSFSTPCKDNMVSIMHVRRLTMRWLLSAHALILIQRMPCKDLESCTTGFEPPQIPKRASHKKRRCTMCFKPSSCKLCKVYSIYRAFPPLQTHVVCLLFWLVFCSPRVAGGAAVGSTACMACTCRHGNV